MPPSHTASNGKKDNATSDDESMPPSHTASNGKKDNATSDDESMPPSPTASNGKKNNATSDDESMPPPSVTASPYNIPLRKTGKMLCLMPTVSVFICIPIGQVFVVPIYLRQAWICVKELMLIQKFMQKIFKNKCLR